MENKISLFIATSLDGYIADQDENLEWLFSAEGQGEAGYYKEIDNVIMGSRTFDWMETHLDKWPYDDKNCYIFSRKDHSETTKAEFVNPDNLLSFSKNLTGNTWIVGGGKIIKSFLENQLIDEITLAVAPVLFGQGVSLFPQGDYEQKLELLGTRTFGQFVELKYKVNHS